MLTMLAASPPDPSAAAIDRHMLRPMCKAIDRATHRKTACPVDVDVVDVLDFGNATDRESLAHCSIADWPWPSRGSQSGSSTRNNVWSLIVSLSKCGLDVVNSQ